MNKKQIQLEICKAMLDANSRLRIETIGKNTIAVTVNGYIAYAFSIDECVFDRTQIPPLNNNTLGDMFRINGNDELMKATAYSVICGGIPLKKLACENFNCYINEKFYEQIAGFRLYGYASDKRILALDDFNCPVAVVCPVRVIEDEL